VAPRAAPAAVARPPAVGTPRNFKECNDLARSLLLNAAEAVGKTVKPPPREVSRSMDGLRKFLLLERALH